MIEIYLLYVLPFACRFGLSTSTAEWWRIVASLAPVVVVAPSTYVARFVRDEEREHVWRHALYSLAFTVSVGTSIRWDYVYDHWVECRTLVAYLVVGGVTLWWFVVSHILENTGMFNLHTHQGDVAVLPLTLVSIATFASDVPDDAFQFSRSVVFFVPVVVAWATLFFIAYHEFASGRTTTLMIAGYTHHARAALIIASTHLSLLECNAPPEAFILFSAVAALLCQVTPRHTSAPQMRPAWRAGILATSLAFGVALGYVIRYRLGVGAQVSAGVATVVGSLAIPPIAGRWWVMPGAAYASLAIGAYAHAEGTADVQIVDALALAGGCYVTLWMVNLLASPVWTPDPPGEYVPPPPRGAASSPPPYRPQDDASWYAPSRLLRCVAGCGWVGGRTYTTDTPRERMGAVNAHCPDAFRGVWWMDGNTFPMDLIVIHDRQWSEDGTSAWMWDFGNTTRDATLAGVLLALGSLIKTTRIELYDDDWIRTTGWNLPGVRLLFNTYWIRRVGPDELERLVFAADGRLVWRYSLLRVQRADGTRTRFHAHYAAACVGRRYIG